MVVLVADWRNRFLLAVMVRLGAGLEVWHGFVDPSRFLAGGCDGGEVGAADGAGDMGGEPHVDAIRVEDMAALGQQPERLLVLELAKADRALERALPQLEVLHLRVGEGRKGVDHGLAEPTVGRPARPGSDAAERVDGVAAATAAADVDREEAHEEEGADEDDDDDGHGGAETGEARGRRRRRVSRGFILGGDEGRRDDDKKKEGGGRHGRRIMPKDLYKT